MYLTSHFQQPDVVQLHDLIVRHSFGLLISQFDGQPFASHLPLLLDRTSGTHGELIGHMARANPQWQQAGGTTVLAVFSGPHAYISPSWYEAENVVPTWNYAAVHAYGVFEAIHDPLALTAIVRAYVEHYERGMPAPWSLSGSPHFVERLVEQIVGFRIPIERLEGKWKLSQNHPRERREKVIAALKRQEGEESLAIAALMQETLQRRAGGSPARD
jgi:transcriptional regulator